MFDPCNDVEIGLAGVAVTLIDAFLNEIAQTITDSEGYYIFEDLPPGRYSYDVNIDYPNCPTPLPSSLPSGFPSTSQNPSDKPSSGPTKSLEPSNSPSFSQAPSYVPSIHPSSSFAPTIHASDGPSLSLRPTAMHSESPSVSHFPSTNPSSFPSSSLKPSITLSAKPSASHAPSSNPSLKPSQSQMPSTNPSSSPTDGFVFDGRVFHPCYVDSDVPLAGATIFLHGINGVIIAETTTDETGYYAFLGFPKSRYSISVQDPPTCRRLSNSLADVGSRSQSGLFDYIPTGNVERLEEEEANIKFYEKGDACDTKIPGDWNATISDDWAGITLFDTLDECCANMLWYDMEGCFSRSRVAFQFEFCISISGIDWLSNCPLSEIRAVEKAMQIGLRDNSEVLIFVIGDMMLTNEDGEIKCIGQSEQQEDKLQKLRGGFPNVISSQDASVTCGKVTTKESGCREEACLMDTVQKVVSSFQGYFDNGGFSNAMHSIADDRMQPHRTLQSIEVIASSFTTKKLLLPSTIISDKSADDIETTSDHSVTSSDVPNFYPTWISGQLCNSKTSFDSWEESFTTLAECCKAHYSWDYSACCKSYNMGGC